MDTRRPLTKEDLLRMNLPRRFWEARFERVTEHMGVNKSYTLKDVVRNYLEKFETMVEKGAGMMLWGQNGLGKTCAAAVVAMEARRRGRSVLFITAAEYMQCVHNKVWFDTEQTMADRARAVDILVIDDFGKDYRDSKGFADKMFEDLLRTRSANVRVTILTMNMALEKFIETAPPSVTQVLKEVVVPIEVTGPDRRDEASQELASLLVGNSRA